MFRNFNFQDIFGKEYKRFSRPLNSIMYQPYRETISCFLKASSTEGPLEQAKHLSQLPILLLLPNRGAGECFIFSFQNVFVHFLFPTSVVLRFPFKNYI